MALDSYRVHIDHIHLPQIFVDLYDLDSPGLVSKSSLSDSSVSPDADRTIKKEAVGKRDVNLATDENSN